MISKFQYISWYIDLTRKAITLIMAFGRAGEVKKKRAEEKKRKEKKGGKKREKREKREKKEGEIKNLRT